MTEVWSALEECYEFMLAYAAKGLATDEDRGSEDKSAKWHAVNALSGRKKRWATAIQNESGGQRDALLELPGFEADSEGRCRLRAKSHVRASSRGPTDCRNPGSPYRGHRLVHNSSADAWGVISSG